MLHFLLTAALLLPAPLQDSRDPDEPDPKVVAAAVKDLEEAFKKKEFEERVAAIVRNSEVVHPDVIELLGQAIKKDKADEVVLESFKALRWMDHPEALELLHRTYKKNKKLRKKYELYAALLQAIGQHGSEESISILADKPFSVQSRQVIAARVLGLGHVRSPKSVEALIGAMRTAGEKRVMPHMADFRTSLMVLTGVDQGTAQQPWIDWWNGNKKSFEVPERPALLPRALQYRWDRYWGYDTDYGRGTKREDRGGDPEKDE